MMTLPQSRFGLPAVTLVVWALAAASLVYWGLRLAGGNGPAVLAPVLAAPAPPVDTQTVARLLAHRIMVMQRGVVVETGLTDQVLDDPRHEYTQLLVSSVLQA